MQPERFRRNRWSGGCRHPPSRFGLPNLRPAALFVIRRQDLNTGRSDVEYAFRNSLRARGAILSSHTSTTFLPKYRPSSGLTAADTGGRACYAFAPRTRRSFPASLLAASSDRRLRFRVCIDIAELTSEPNIESRASSSVALLGIAAQPCVRAPLHQLGNGFPPLFGLNTQVPRRVMPRCYSRLACLRKKPDRGMTQAECMVDYLSIAPNAPPHSELDLHGRTTQPPQLALKGWPAAPFPTITRSR